MSVLFMDGCDHYNASQINRKWTSSSVVTHDATGGRFGGGAIEVNISALKSIPDTATLVVGFAAKRETSGGTETLMRLLDSGTEQIDLHWRADNSLEIFGGGASRATTAAILTIDTWHSFEILSTVHGSTGALSVRVNGVDVISVSGIDTQVSANAFVNQMELRGNANTLYDDIYITDDTSFIGDQRITTLVPDGEGNFTEFSTTFPASPTTHYTSIDESPSDDDTSYNESTTSGHRDSTTMSDLVSLSGGTTIKAVQHVYTAKKDDAGAKNMRGFLRVNGTNYNGADQALTTSYVSYTDVYDTDPDTAAAWIKTGVDATEAGYEVRP